jgi:hypothetical protein
MVKIKVRSPFAVLGELTTTLDSALKVAEWEGYPTEMITLLTKAEALAQDCSRAILMEQMANSIQGLQEE